jgi:hypothetical protein
MQAAACTEVGRGLDPDRSCAPAGAYCLRAPAGDFDLKKDGKVVGRVHRVVSADGKTLTVHNTGVQASGPVGDETLVFDTQ